MIIHVNATSAWVSIILRVVSCCYLSEIDGGNVLVPVESYDVFVLLSGNIEGFTVIVEIDTGSLPGG